jgi:aminopeptidase N
MLCRLFASSCLVVLLVASQSLAEKPFEFASTPGKLSKSIVPTEYNIRIVPNVDARTFAGTEIIKIKVTEPVRQLVMNALELQVEGAMVDDQPIAAGALKLERQQELVTIRLPSELSPGDHAVGLIFTGKINQQGQGLFYATYQEEGTGDKKTLLGTQFEATDARRLFPCWDEPSFRARFQLTVVVPPTWSAVSNMPVESESTGNVGKEVRFGMTPPMASYLNVLVAGELDHIDAVSGGVQIRVITTKGKAETGRYALESSVRILEYYNEYFGSPYPLPKLDQIALPGGFGGAMENWGGITYYESALLFDPAKHSDEAKHDVFAVLAHEMAHQWFGDLVTMAWWDNLWLNEGFASWLGTKCTDHFNPQWQVWLRTREPRDPTRRVGIPKEQAMEDDARATTHPIQQPVANEAEANSAFDDITYLKGQSFLRMLESFVGEDTFREGIRRYIAAHKYSNSTTADLWNALSEASNRPINEVAAAWTEQPGFPVVKVRQDETGNVGLYQERFAVHYKNPRPLDWKVPLTYQVLGGAPATKLMTSRNDTLPDIAGDKPFKLNVDGAGYYRAQYDPTMWDRLVASLNELGPADRVNLVGDTWALVQSNRAPLAMFTRLVGKLPRAAELPQWQEVMTAFDYIDRLLVRQPSREPFREYVRATLRPVFDQLGWDPTPDEAVNLATLRASLIALLGAVDDPDTVSGCRERFEKFLTDPAAIPPDLRRPMFATVAAHGDAKTWETLHQLGRKTTDITEKQNYYDALAHARDPKLVEQTLALALTDEQPASRAAFYPARVARESDHPDLAWEFARANMKQLLGKTDALNVNRYAASLFTFFSDPQRANELKAYAKASLPASSAREVAKVVDEIEFRSDFKKRLTSQLETALHPND